MYHHHHFQRIEVNHILCNNFLFSFVARRFVLFRCLFEFDVVSILHNVDPFFLRLFSNLRFNRESTHTHTHKISGEHIFLSAANLKNTRISAQSVRWMGWFVKLNFVICEFEPMNRFLYTFASRVCTFDRAGLEQRFIQRKCWHSQFVESNKPNRAMPFDSIIN